VLASGPPLEGRFQVSPQIAGAIKAVTGVEMVETL
jgi:DNA polymerase III subunit alpha